MFNRRHLALAGIAAGGVLLVAAALAALSWQPRPTAAPPVALAGAASPVEGQKPRPAAGNPAPDFWATWCPPCMEEMPDIQSLHEQQVPDLVILAVNRTDTERSVSAVGEFMAEHGYEFQVLLDPDGKLADRYQFPSIPTSPFIGPDGVLRAKHYGAMSPSRMKDYIDKARQGINVTGVRPF